MIDRWKKAADSDKASGTILADLSKVFDCICHDLLVVKLHAYGLSLLAFKTIQDCLFNQKQITEIGRLWENIISGVTQGLILGPILLIIF